MRVSCWPTAVSWWPTASFQCTSQVQIGEVTLLLMGGGDPAETSVSAVTSRMTLNHRALVSRAGMNARKPSFLLFVQKCFILNAVICYLSL